MIQKRLNHYTIIESLGQGGMGEVYVAEDSKLNRRVALKVLTGLTASDPERRARFEREARAVAALNHPNIVTIHSVEEADGVPFLTMELVEGRLLSSLITPGGMPLDALLRTGIGISDAIAAAHQKGITHRDLKPANVMITNDGRVKVLDFGLAKLREAELDADGVTQMPASDLTGEGPHHRHHRLHVAGAGRGQGRRPALGHLLAWASCSTRWRLASGHSRATRTFR